MMFVEVLGNGHRRDRSKVNVVVKFCKEMINHAGIVELSMNQKYLF